MGSRLGVEENCGFGFGFGFGLAAGLGLGLGLDAVGVVAEEEDFAAGARRALQPLKTLAPTPTLPLDIFAL